MFSMFQFIYILDCSFFVMEWVTGQGVNSNWCFVGILYIFFPLSCFLLYVLPYHTTTHQVVLGIIVWFCAMVWKLLLLLFSLLALLLVRCCSQDSVWSCKLSYLAYIMYRHVLILEHRFHIEFLWNIHHTFILHPLSTVGICLCCFSSCW